MGKHGPPPVLVVVHDHQSVLAPISWMGTRPGWDAGAMVVVLAMAAMDGAVSPRPVDCAGHGACFARTRRSSARPPAASMLGAACIRSCAAAHQRRVQGSFGFEARAVVSASPSPHSHCDGCRLRSVS
jgi:hypothetical protein